MMPESFLYGMAILKKTHLNPSPHSLRLKFLWADHFPTIIPSKVGRTVLIVFLRFKDKLSQIEAKNRKVAFLSAPVYTDTMPNLMDPIDTIDPNHRVFSRVFDPFPTEKSRGCTIHRSKSRKLMVHDLPTILMLFRSFYITIFPWKKKSK